GGNRRRTSAPAESHAGIRAVPAWTRPADDARRYRDQGEVDDAWAKEPLQRLRNYLVDQGYWDEVKEEELLSDCAERVQAAVEEYQDRVQNHPQPIDSMFDYMFKNLPHTLEAQREIARRFPAKGGHH
ncbi:MAG: thiamine pyrophosphate-dependent enzyme, partial [Wenzhouxiangellaceae bacterium]